MPHDVQPAATVAPLTWWKHQSQFMGDASRFRLVRKGRQSGMSTCIAAETMATAAAGRLVLIVSASERQASELLRKVKTFATIAAPATGGRIRTTRDAADTLEFSSGGRVVSLPASAATVQGFAADAVYFDEAAWILGFDEIYSALLPSITQTNGRCTLVSTPRGKSGRFYELDTGGSSLWSRHVITIDDVVAGGAPINLAELREAVADESTWRALYQAEYIDEAYALLSFDLLQSRTDPAIPYQFNAATLPDQCDLYIGIDIGRKHDMTVAAVVELTPTGFISRGFIELKQTGFAEQRVVLSPLIADPRVRRVVIDATGIGAQLAEEFTRAQPHKVEGVAFTLALKSDIAGRMLRVFQTGEIVIPDHAPLISDLHSVEREVTSAGTIRYSAGREHGSHADRFTALALAVFAGNARPAPVTFDIVNLGQPAATYKAIEDRSVAEIIEDESLWTPCH